MYTCIRACMYTCRVSRCSTYSRQFKDYHQCMGFYPRLLSESRIFADYTDFADYWVWNIRSFSLGLRYTCLSDFRRNAWTSENIIRAFRVIRDSDNKTVRLGNRTRQMPYGESCRMPCAHSTKGIHTVDLTWIHGTKEIGFEKPSYKKNS